MREADHGPLPVKVTQLVSRNPTLCQSLPGGVWEGGIGQDFSRAGKTHLFGQPALKSGLELRVEQVVEKLQGWAPLAAPDLSQTDQGHR